MCACMWFQTTGDVKRYKTGDDDNFSQVSSTDTLMIEGGAIRRRSEGCGGEELSLLCSHSCIQRAYLGGWGTQALLY